jgi:uncharacterized membrane protein YhaH (DUF805 family)
MRERWIQGVYKTLLCAIGFRGSNQGGGMWKRQAWLLFGFKGRAHRADLWTYFVVVLPLVGLIKVLEGGGAEMLANALWLPVLWIQAAFVVKRLHDVGHGGWWAVLACIPYLGAFIGLSFLFTRDKKEDNNFGPYVLPSMPLAAN